jgi:hypothetical protein
MVVPMSGKEFSRLSVLLDVQAGRMRVADAADFSSRPISCSAKISNILACMMRS